MACCLQRDLHVRRSLAWLHSDIIGRGPFLFARAGRWSPPSRGGGGVYDNEEEFQYTGPMGWHFPGNGWIPVRHDHSPARAGFEKFQFKTILVALPSICACCRSEEGPGTKRMVLMRREFYTPHAANRSSGCLLRAGSRISSMRELD